MTLLFTFHLREKWANRGRATKAHQAAHPSPLQLWDRFGTPRVHLPSLGKKANRGRATKAHQAAHLSPSDFGIPHPSNSHPFSLHKPLGLRAEPPPPHSPSRLPSPSPSPSPGPSSRESLLP